MPTSLSVSFEPRITFFEPLPMYLIPLGCQTLAVIRGNLDTCLLGKAER